MSLRQYEYALAIAEEGSVTAAAERLHVAQPSVSQQLRSLENDLGVQLFSRSPGGLIPTMAGRAFLTEAELAVGASRRARAAARNCSEALVGELRVVAESGLGMCQLPHAIGALRREYAGLEVIIAEESDPAALARRMRSGEADVAIATYALPDCPTVVDIGAESYVVVLPAEHPALAGRSCALADLAVEPWVRLARGSAVDDTVDAALRERGLAPRVAARVSQLATASRLAVEGFGVAVVPPSSVPSGYEQFMRPVEPGVSHRVIASARGNPGPAEQLLLDTLVRESWCSAGTFHGAPVSPLVAH